MVKFVLLFLVFFSGCGYQFGQGTLPSQYCTISVPFVDGDQYGDFTAAIVKELSRSSRLRYQRDCGELTLCVKIIDHAHENIGYRYDVEEEDDEEVLTNSIIPVETRLTVHVEVSVIERASGCTVLGPARIRAWIDFDHDYYNSTDAINVTSLGQVNDYDAALDSVDKPLYEIAARKVVDYLNDAW